jgi:hypothetical protein
MIKFDQKQTARQAVHAAFICALNEQNSLCKMIEPFLGSRPEHVILGDEESLSRLASDIELALINPSQWPKELDRIQDFELRGAIGVYQEAIRKMEAMRASFDFLAMLNESN